MEHIDVEIAGNLVIASGSLSLPRKGNELRFTVRDLRIECKFTTVNGEKSSVSRELSTDFKSTVLEFVNFSSSFGTGFHTELGTLDDRRLFLTVYVFTLKEDGPRLVNYTFSVGERVREEGSHE